MQQSIDAITDRIQSGAYGGIDALREILADSPSLWTPTFIANVHKAIEQSLYLKQVLVESPDSTQHRDAMAQP